MAMIIDWLNNLYIEFRRLIGWSRDREIWLFKLKQEVTREPTAEEMNNALIVLNSNEFTHFMADPKQWVWVGVQCKHGEGWDELPEAHSPFPIPKSLLECLEEDSILRDTYFYLDTGVSIPTKCTVRLFNNKEEADSYWKTYLDRMFKQNNNGGSNETLFSGL